MVSTFLGIDIGTTGCKVGIYDLEGHMVASGYKTCGIDMTLQGKAEVEPNAWIDAVAKGIRKVVVTFGVNPNSVAGIAVSGTNGLVPVGEDGAALRPAIMLMDQRSTPQVEEIESILGRDRCFQRAGNIVMPGTVSSPIILWIKENEPRTYEKASKFLAPAGYVNLFLTGRMTIDRSRASMTLLFDQITGKWIPEFCEALGIEQNKLPDVFESHEIIGSLTPKSAEVVGLPSGIPVVAGCTDTVAASVGSGTAIPGQSYMILGTTGRICITSRKPEFHRKLVNTCHITRDRWIHIAAMNSSGLSLQWIKSVLGFEKSTYDEVIALANDVSAGANGVIFLPYLVGERSPIWNPKAKGVFFGLSISTDAGALVRSVLEGVAYAFADNIEIIEESYGHLGQLKLGGGGARSAIWPQILSDVSGKELVLMDNPDLETLGCAMVAALGTGYYSSVEEILDSLTKVVSVVTPQSDRRTIYAERLRVYRQLYSELCTRFFKR